MKLLFTLRARNYYYEEAIDKFFYSTHQRTNESSRSLVINETKYDLIVRDTDSQYISGNISKSQWQTMRAVVDDCLVKSNKKNKKVITFEEQN